MMMARAHGIVLKKKHGQHFLKDQSVVDTMIGAVTLDPATWVLEIGCGDGFLTRSILNQTIAGLWVFEIDPEWADYVQEHYPDPRLHVFQDNILDVNWARLAEGSPAWTILSNLPYSVTFPILRLFKEHRQLITEGVVMVQEEVAEKLLKTEGRKYGFISLYFQHYFEWQPLTKIPPTAFFPPPKVTSRLLYFKPRAVVDQIPDEEQFWRFIKICFSSPRRTLRNNLKQTHYDLSGVAEALLDLRAQQMRKDDLLALWQELRVQQAG